MPDIIGILGNSQFDPGKPVKIKSIEKREIYIMTEVLGKKELVARLAESAGATKVQSARDFDNFVEVIKTALEAGETVRIPGLVTLTSEVKEAHTMEMYDFQAGDGSRKTVEVPEKRVYKARFSKALSK